MKNIFNKKTKLALLIFSFLLWDIFSYAPDVFSADDAEDIQDKIEKYQNQLEKTQQELSQNQVELKQTEAEIGTTKSLIKKTETEISRKEAEIDDLEKKIELNKKILESYLREAYYNYQELGNGLMFSEEGFQKIAGLNDQMSGMKEKISGLLNETQEAKDKIEGDKVVLADKKEDHEKLLNMQSAEHSEIKGDIKQAEASLAELNAKINKMKGELSKLLGSSVSYKNILDAAAYASKVTGIRKDYLLGVLVVESNLGRFTGGCNFKESKMSGSRAETFKKICKELKYDYNKQKVSCPPKGYKGTGGAMGVAQFMPDTWVGYKSSIASVTGHNPPDPWNLTDGVVAMALKLTKVDGVKQHKKSAEAKAYCVYLAGGNWASYCDNKGANYGDLVLYWADNYEKKL